MYSRTNKTVKKSLRLISAKIIKTVCLHQQENFRSIYLTHIER